MENVNWDVGMNISDFYNLSDINHMKEYPLFISYPRTGSHWINAVMELYFNRPRLRESYDKPTFLTKHDNNYMWFHDHDCYGVLPNTGNELVLYRNPVDTIYSNMVYYGDEINDETVFLRISHYKKWIAKWITHTSNTLVKYDNFIKDPVCEFSKISQHFNIAVNKNKILNIFSYVTKERMESVSNDAINKNMLTDTYKNTRNQFKEKYSNIIGKIYGSMDDK